MIDFENKTISKIDISLLKKIAGDISSKDFELILTNNHDIQIINKQYRHIDKHTDVLSFGYDNAPLQGSIIISYDYVKKNSQKYCHLLTDELALLFIHGMLHTLGYDHTIDNGEMRQKEVQLIKQYNLPDSLIVRAEE